MLGPPFTLDIIRPPLGAPFGRLGVVGLGLVGEFSIIVAFRNGAAFRANAGFVGSVFVAAW